MSTLITFLKLAVEKSPDKTAIEDKDGTISFRDLDSYSDSAALYFSDFIVSPGDRVVVRGVNSINYVIVILGLLKARAGFCPVFSSAPPDQVNYIIDDSQATAFIEILESEVLVNNKVVSHGNLFYYQCDSGNLCQNYPLPEDLACLIYTSGSTGKPKGIATLHKQSFFVINAILEKIDYYPSDVVLTLSPFSFDYGLYQVFICFASQSKLFLSSEKDSGVFILKTISSTNANVLAAVPSMIDNMALLLKRIDEFKCSLRTITSTGASVNQSSIDVIRQEMPDVSFQLMYGLTECKRVSIAPLDADISRPGTCGLPLSGTEVKIVNEDGVELKANAMGYIVVIGPHLMSGYWGAKELTEKTFKTKFDVLRELHTGDLGWLDEEGYLFCAGRNKDIFKQGGYRVSCIEVEAAAMSANCAEAAALIPPVKDKKSKLFVLSSDKSFDFKGYLRTKIEEYKIPNKVIVLDSMPINQNGKIDKVELENY